MPSTSPSRTNPHFVCRVSRFERTTSLTVCMNPWDASPGLRLSLPVSQDARRQEPAELAERLGRKDVEVDATDCALFELNGRTSANQPRGELADVGLVA